MSADNTDPLGNAGDCGCCTGTARQTPANVSNRPGLSAVAYRVGTQPQFKQSLLTRLSASAGLKTRQDDDFSIALADAWAAVADVLTFYQERIANESYVRTATERRSLLELARLIGYEPGPGVAATVYLAFTLESAPGAPAQAAAPVTIDVGTRLQSIPGPGEKPQTFETVEKITARVEWNAIRPRMHERHPIPLPDDPDRLYLQGTATNLQPGDTLLITPDDSSKPVQFQRIVEVVPDAARQRTSVRVSSIQAVPPAPPRVHSLGPHHPPGATCAAIYAGHTPDEPVDRNGSRRRTGGYGTTPGKPAPVQHREQSQRRREHRAHATQHFDVGVDQQYRARSSPSHSARRAVYRRGPHHRLSAEGDLQEPRHHASATSGRHGDAPARFAVRPQRPGLPQHAGQRESKQRRHGKRRLASANGRRDQPRHGAQADRRRQLGGGAMAGRTCPTR